MLGNDILRKRINIQPSQHAHLNEVGGKLVEAIAERGGEIRRGGRNADHSSTAFYPDAASQRRIITSQ